MNARSADSNSLNPQGRNEDETRPAARSTRSYVVASSRATRPVVNLHHSRRRSALQLPWIGLFPGR